MGLKGRIKEVVVQRRATRGDDSQGWLMEKGLQLLIEVKLAM
jgi:hypothetical protein